VYSEKLLMVDRGTVRNMQRFIPKNKFEKLVHLVGFIIRIFFDIFFDITVFAELHDTHLQNRIALQVI